jgi:aryl-alcohol dehydrogenase-like predicted oxidoreductase
MIGRDNSYEYSFTRRLGALEIPAIGMGCWAIGGPFWFGTQPLGWGEVDDKERKILSGEGRTLAQGALAWIWARSPQTIPIPGFRTVKQVEENIGALRFGPLSHAAVQEIAGLLGT